MHAFILAGGFATRLWPLTEKRPKPLLPLAGKPLLSHMIEHIPQDMPVTVSTNAVFETAFRKWAHTVHRPVFLNIEPSTHDDVKLGALGAVAHWLQKSGIDDDILLLTGDNYFGFRIHHFVEQHTAGIATVAAYDVGDKAAARQFGTVVMNPDGKHVAAFEEKPPEPKSSLVSTGCSILPRATLPILLEYAAKKPDNVGGIFEELLHRGLPIHAYTFQEPWFDIGAFQSYMHASRQVAGSGTHTHPSASIDELSQCDGTVILGEHTQVHRSILKNCVIFANCQIENCHLEDCVIDDHCHLQGIDLRTKMLRSHTTLISPQRG